MAIIRWIANRQARQAARRDGVSVLGLFPDDEAAEDWLPRCAGLMGCSAAIAAAVGCRCLCADRCGAVASTTTGSFPSRKALPCGVPLMTITPKVVWQQLIRTHAWNWPTSTSIARFSLVSGLRTFSMSAEFKAEANVLRYRPSERHQKVFAVGCQFKELKRPPSA